MLSLKVFVSCAFVLWSGLISTAFTQTHEEADGIVMLQAESEAGQGGWSRESSIPGYSGMGYPVWEDADAFTESTAGRGTITCKFRIQRAGNYQMRWRSRITRGNNHTELNDSWVRFPSGQNISGDHILQISGRSSGHAIDRIALYRYVDVDFSASKFDGLPDSHLGGGGTTDNPPAPAPVFDYVMAPLVSVSDNVLTWPAMDANAVNVHRGTGEWLETLPATQTR